MVRNNELNYTGCLTNITGIDLTKNVDFSNMKMCEDEDIKTVRFIIQDTNLEDLNRIWSTIQKSRSSSTEPVVFGNKANTALLIKLITWANSKDFKSYIVIAAGKKRRRTSRNPRCKSGGKYQSRATSKRPHTSSSRRKRRNRRRTTTPSASTRRRTLRRRTTPTTTRRRPTSPLRRPTRK